MKSLIHIKNAVYNKPWAILPSVHETIRTQLEAALEGKLAMPPMPPEDDPMDEEDMLKDMTAELEGNIAIIRIEGIIGKHLSMLETMCGGCDCDVIAEKIQEATDDANIDGIVLYFNTPGGSVTGVPELADLIAKCAPKKSKGIVGYCDVLCASAGIWLASQCTSFYSAASADIGSVGVYSIYTDQSRALEDAGIKVNAIVSDGSPMKLAGAPFRAMSDVERAMFQADVDKIYTQFKTAVQSNRPVADADCNGQVFDGETACIKGFCDGNLSCLDELLQLLGQTE